MPLRNPETTEVGVFEDEAGDEAGGRGCGEMAFAAGAVLCNNSAPREPEHSH